MCVSSSWLEIYSRLVFKVFWDCMVGVEWWFRVWGFFKFGSGWFRIGLGCLFKSVCVCVFACLLVACLRACLRAGWLAGWLACLLAWPFKTEIKKKKKTGKYSSRSLATLKSWNMEEYPLQCVETYPIQKKTQKDNLPIPMAGACFQKSPGHTCETAKSSWASPLVLRPLVRNHKCAIHIV